jgi:hypothetical protein
VVERARIAIQPPALLEVVGHELRTPATILYGGTSLLRDHDLAGSTRRMLLDEMAHDAARLVRFLDDLLPWRTPVPARCGPSRCSSTGCSTSWRSRSARSTHRFP